MLLTAFNQVSDTRRAQGRQYDLKYILFFSILAMLSGADSYRKIESFIKENFQMFREKFDIKWRQSPGYTTIRNIIQGINSKELEKAFREYSKNITKLKSQNHLFVCLDGKAVRGSFDNFQDKRAIQVLSAFLTGKNIILAHEEVSKNKKNEIESAKKIIKNLNLQNAIFTMDALHCQKKR